MSTRLDCKVRYAARSRMTLGPAVQIERTDMFIAAKCEENTASAEDDGLADEVRSALAEFDAADVEQS